ncbi:MAG TPA: response regulator transcription factor [Cellvibrionaceae bacterium]|nr:response regulator transcription factor [Cellvibrionaceae bacterium]
MSVIILVVEDEIKIADLIAKYLALEGYEAVTVQNGADALARFKQLRPQLVILDIMLPGLDGLEVCKRLRTIADTPIIFLTARIQDVDRLMGFAAGADDYVCKPFNPQELMARVKAILRRSQPPGEAAPLCYEDIALVLSENSAFVGGIKIQLTQIEFKLLSMFVEQPNKVFTREELLLSSHGKYTESYERTIDFHIKNLRKKINAPSDSRYIQTIYGLGYKLVN